MTRSSWIGCLVGALACGAAVAADVPGIQDLPDTKEGLWVGSTVMPGAASQPIRSTMCTSNAVNRKVYDDTHRNPNTACKEIRHDRTGSVLTSETECNRNGKVTRSTVVVTLTGNTGTHTEMRKADGSPGTVVDMKWVGACPAGMKLGDVTGPDGKVMFNALDR